MSEQEIENVDATGMPVKRRVPTADVLRYMHQDFVTADAEASKTRARIIGLINGNPPFSNKKLKDEGQTFRRNFNPRDSEAIIDPLCTADFNLVFDTHYSIKVTFTPGFFSDAYIAQAQGEKIAQAYTHVFKNSAKIVEASQRGIRDKNELGVGFFINTNTYDWRPKAVARGRVFFNPSASADGSDLGEVTVIDTMTISEIFDTIDKGTTASKAGWNIDALKVSVAAFYYKSGRVSKDYKGNYMLAYEDIVRRARAYDAGILRRQYELFPIIHGFVTERTGKVTHSIIPQVSPPGEDRFLYDAFETADNMLSLITPFPFDYGDGTLAGVKGQGHRIYSLCVEAAKSLMRTLDSVDLASSMIAKNVSGDNMAFSMHRFGPLTLLDRGLEPINIAFAPPVGPSMEAREMLLRILGNNAGVFRAHMEDTSKRESVKTAEQVRYEGNKEATYDKNRMFQTYMHWDRFHKERFKRLLDPRCKSSAAPVASRKEVELFWAMCDALGVSKELLTKFKDKIHVAAIRSIGSGSTFSQINNLATIKTQGLTHTMSERGRVEVDKQYVSALIGNDNLEMYYEIDGQETPSNQSSIANLEVNDFYEGSPVIVGIDQNHTAHIVVHLAAMQGEAQAFQQDPMAMDVERTAMLFQNGIPHTMRHIEILSADPTREKQVIGYQQAIQQLTQFYQQIAQMAEELQQQKAQEIERLRAQLQEAQQQNSKVERDYQLKSQEMQGRLQIEQQKTDSLNQSRQEKTEVSKAVTTEKAGQSMAIKSQQHQQDMTERMTKLQMDIQEMQVKIAKLTQEK